MSYKSNYTGEQIDKVIGDNLEVSIKDLKRELDDAKDIVVYQIPSDWTEVGKQYQITQDNFHNIFGSEDELLKNLENKHVRLKIFGTDESAKITIDVTTSLQAKVPSATSVTYIINFNGIASNDVEDFFTVYALDVRCGIGIDKLTDGTYSFVGGSFEIIQKENSVTTEEIADDAVTTEKIADGAITQDKLADGVGKDIVTYDITELEYSVEQGESRQQVELNVDLINKVFGSPDSLMYNLENKHVRFTELGDGIVSNTDVTSSITIGETEGYLSLTYAVGILGETVVTSSYLFIFDKTKEPHTFTYGHVTQYTDVDQITTGLIADEAVTTEKIANKAVTTAKIANGAITKDKIAEGVIKSTDEVITPNSTNPVSSKAVYNAIYSVLNTEV